MRHFGTVAATLLGLVSAGCGGGGGGGGTTPLPVIPPPTPETPPGPLAVDIGPYDPLPGVVMTLVGTSGGTGPAGTSARATPSTSASP